MNLVVCASLAVLMQGAAQPPLLSTTPTPPPGAPSEPTQMSGMPLQVGDLPPGTVAVRVIRQSFANNVVNHPVELQVIGPDGLMLEEKTDAAGRATFRDLRVGRLVFARTSLDGESLMSQQFDLPAQGGVRLVLVGGVGAGAALNRSVPLAPLPPATPIGGAVADAAPVAPKAAPPTTAQTWAASVLAMLTIGTGVYWSRARRRTHAPSRDDLFEALVAVERGREDGRIDESAYRVRREALIDELCQRHSG